MESVDKAITAIQTELVKALLTYPTFHSAHEGFAVLYEEVDELWDEVRARQGNRDVTAMRAEAVQVAAMAIRFIIDVCHNDESGQK